MLDMKRNIVNLLKRDMIFFIFLLILIIFSLLFPKEIINYPKAVDWKTILMLSGLLITTTGIKESKVLRKFIELILKRSHSERGYRSKINCYNCYPFGIYNKRHNTFYLNSSYIEYAKTAKKRPQ